MMENIYTNILHGRSFRRSENFFLKPYMHLKGWCLCDFGTPEIGNLRAAKINNYKDLMKFIKSDRIERGDILIIDTKIFSLKNHDRVNLFVEKSQKLCRKLDVTLIAYTKHE